MNKSARLAGSVLVALAAVCTSANAQQPFKLGVEERGYIQDPSGESAYPMPQMVGRPMQGNVDKTEKKKPKPPALRGGASDSGVQRPTIQGGVQKSAQLPQGFMGQWVVNGLRKDIQAQPQYRAAIPEIFSEQTEDTWNITGDPGKGYAFSNQHGVKSAIFVDKVEGGTAFIRYQHPIQNTMAQEAIVMQIAPGGMQFTGLERITIVKQGEPPRAQVTYQLVGRRRN